MTEGIEIRRFLKKIRTTQVLPNKHNIVDKHRFGDARISAVYAQAKRYTDAVIEQIENPQ